MYESRILSNSKRSIGVTTKFVLFLTLSFCFLSNAYPQSIETIRVELTREVTEEESTEVTKGTIFYQAPQIIVLKITEPIYQWMMFDGNSMRIYYPNERKAFYFNSETPFSLPFFQVFLEAAKPGFELTEVGFTLERNQVKEDTLFTYWIPPKQLKNEVENAILALAQDRLVFVELQDTEGKRLARTTYSQHFQYGEAFFPLEIVKVRYHDNSSTVEKTIYSNPQFNIPLSEEALDMKIPADVEVEEIEW